MRFTTDGLILKEQKKKKKDKLVTVFTRSNGLIRCFVRNARNIKSVLSSSTQPLNYSRLSIYEGRDSYIIDEADSIAMFYELREDLEKLSLANYFCEVCCRMLPDGQPADELLSLILNSLYVLLNTDKHPLLIKSVFELRFMGVSGFMPDILCCCECGDYEAEKMYFLLNESKLICSRCYKSGDACPLSRCALMGLRTALLTDPKRLFAFELEGESLYQLADCAEKFLLTHSEQPFPSLLLYKDIRNMN